MIHALAPQPNLALSQNASGKDLALEKPAFTERK
jgi:hypothetical protein